MIQSSFDYVKSAFIILNDFQSMGWDLATWLTINEGQYMCTFYVAGRETKKIVDWLLWWNWVIFSLL